MAQARPSAEAAALRRRGVMEAVAAYSFWGGLPLFYWWLRHVPPHEIVAHRILWSVALILLLLLVRGTLGELANALRQFRLVRPLIVSALLIGVNWLVYIWAVGNGHVIAASLGYFLNPLVNVLLGRLVLNERLSRLQWVAVGIAAAGVAILAIGALTTLWISLTLALSFGTYGLIRKMAPTGPLIGLGIETLILLPPSLAYLLWLGLHGKGAFGMSDWHIDLLLMAGGPVTTIPLLLFAAAARKLNYATIGIIQYIGPTSSLLIAVFLLGEQPTQAQMIAFPLIWSALAIYSFALWRQARSVETPA